MRVPTSLIVGSLILGGCNTTPNTTVAENVPDGIRTRDASTSLHDTLINDNRELEVELLGSGSEVVMMIASIHGDESAGTPLLRRLATHLKSNPDLLSGVQLVLVPAHSPPRMRIRRRRAPRLSRTWLMQRNSIRGFQPRNSSSAMAWERRRFATRH